LKTQALSGFSGDQMQREKADFGRLSSGHDKEFMRRRASSRARPQNDFGAPDETPGRRLVIGKFGDG
jgi:hypothetical protein